MICNVGAVGYPRDGDWRACYVLFDGKTIWFRRVEYGVETTIRKISAIPTRANFYGDRLREGGAHLASHPKVTPKGKSWWQFWK